MTPAGDGGPMAAPIRSARRVTAMSPRRMACPTNWIDTGTPSPSSPHGTTAAGCPVTLNIAWKGTGRHQRQGGDRPEPPVGPMRDGPVAVPGVMTTSTSSKIDRMRPAIHFPQCGLRPTAGRRTTRRYGRSCGYGPPNAPGAAALHIVVHPAEVARQGMCIHRRRRIVQVTGDHVMASSRSAPASSTAARCAAPPRHRAAAPWCSARPQPARRPCRRDDALGPAAVRSRRGKARRPRRFAIGPLTLSPHHAPSCSASTRSRCGLTPNSRTTSAGSDRTHAIGTRPWRSPRPPPRRCRCCARRVRGVPRVAGRSEADRLGERPDHQLQHRGLPDDHRARRPQPPHHLGVLRRRRSVGTAAIGRHLPATSMSSLIAIGTPSSGNSLASSRACAAAASWRAESASTTTR